MSNQKHHSSAGLLAAGVLLGVAGTLLARELYKAHIDGGIAERFGDITDEVKCSAGPVVNKTREVFDKIHGRYDDIKNGFTDAVRDRHVSEDITEDDFV